VPEPVGRSSCLAILRSQAQPCIMRLQLLLPQWCYVRETQLISPNWQSLATWKSQAKPCTMKPAKAVHHHKTASKVWQLTNPAANRLGTASLPRPTVTPSPRHLQPPQLMLCQRRGHPRSFGPRAVDCTSNDSAPPRWDWIPCSQLP
jgi:hypothetical protein